MDKKIKIFFFFILIILIFCADKINAAGELTYLDLLLKGNCFLTVKLSDNTIAGMDFEKGKANVPQKAIYSGLYSEPQYLIFVNPDPGSYYLTLVGRNEGTCELEIKLSKGEKITFTKTFSESFKKGEMLEAGFTLYKFENYDPVKRIYDITYQAWNIAPGSGKEALSEGFHRPYLEVVPNFIKIGFLTGKNQEIPIIIKTPSCVPPGETSCSIVPAKDITFSLHEIPEDYTSFSENNFSIEANSSKNIKFKVKIPESASEFSGYIYVKSSVGNNIIVVDGEAEEITETEPIIELPIITFDTEEAIAKFRKLSKNTKTEIEIPKEMDLPFTDIKFQALNYLENFQIITKILKEGELANKNIPKIDKNVYRYVEIIKEGIDDKNITNIQVGFKVNKNWIKENEIDANRIKLFKFKDNSWMVLETEKTSEDANSVYYKTSPPDLSTFVIAGEKVEKMSSSKEKETTFGGENVPKRTPAGIIFWIGGSIVILIIVGIVIYFFFKKKKTPKV
jgi:PGF-pre-PGF domain-containing protein